MNQIACLKIILKLTNKLLKIMDKIYQLIKKSKISTWDIS